MKIDEVIMKHFAAVDFYLNRLLKLQQDLAEKVNNGSVDEGTLAQITVGLGEVISGIRCATPMPGPDKSWYDVSKSYREHYDKLEKTVRE